MTTDETQVRRDLIAQLFGAFDRKPSEANYTGYETTLKLMATPRLATLVSTILEGLSDLTDPGEARVPTAGKLWELHRKLKRLPDPPARTLELTPTDSGRLDGWDQNANLLLMQYLWAKHAPKGVMRYHQAGALQCLVRYKHAWASDMREDRAEGGALDGRKHWADCMALAEAEIDRVIASSRAAA